MQLIALTRQMWFVIYIVWKQGTVKIILQIFTIEKPEQENAIIDWKIMIKTD